MNNEHRLTNTDLRTNLTWQFVRSDILVARHGRAGAKGCIQNPAGEIINN